MKTSGIRIQSYEPYHIGIKINPSLATDLISLRYKLINSLGAKSPGIDLTKISSVSGIEVLKSEKEERVELNYDAFALNTVGNNPKNTLRLFKKVVSGIESLDYDVDGFATFQEVVTNVNIKVQNKPIDILKKLSKVKLEPFRDISPIETIGLKFGTPDNKEVIFNIILEVNPVNPQSLLVMRILYRVRAKNKIIEFSNKIENTIYSFITSVSK